MNRSIHGSATLVAGILLAACSPNDEADTSKKSALFTSASSVFISEFHFDNVSTDAGEAIEIQAPAGTDLAGYSLVLYNGNGGAPYNTTALSGVVADAGGGQGVVVVEYPTNGIQNGSPDGIALLNDAGVLLQFLSYEGTFTAVGGPADGILSTDIGAQEGSSTPLGMSLQLVEQSGDLVWVVQQNTFGSLNGSGPSEPDPSAIGECGDTFTPIFSIQGAGFSSPMVGSDVEVEGVVVASSQGAGAPLGGFFIQSLEPDDDAQTSEGLFIFDQNADSTLPVSPGQRVRVLGTVTEFSDLTELVAESVSDCGTAPLPAKAPVPLPVDDLLALEALEGMLVEATNLTVTETYNLGRFGEVLLSTGGRLFQATNSESPADTQVRSILLDDARDIQNPVPVPYLGEDSTLRLGDSLPSVSAVMHEAFGAYRLQPVDRESVVFARSNRRSPAPAAVGGNVRVASLNVLNYFTTLNERGADTDEELVRQRAKLVGAVIALDADVVGLTEIENNDASGSPIALDDFVASVNDAIGADVYARAPDPSDTGSDAIRGALIYKPASVTPVGPALSDTNPVPSRPPIAQSFSARGNVFSVIVNHFKSKGSCPSDPEDPNSEQGQGCWNVLRTEQAEGLLNFVQVVQAESGDDDVVVLGDLNSYFAEDPIDSLTLGGLVNQIASLDPQERYSYVFNGYSGVLDYALTTPSLSVTGVDIWHINSDEPRILDYNTEFNPPSLYSPDVYRSSDHDPVLVGLDLAPDMSFLFSELIALIESLPQEETLGTFVTRALLAPIHLAENKVVFAEERGNDSLLGAVALWVAEQSLEAFQRQVERLESRGRLSSSVSDSLLEKSEELLSLL